MNVLFIYSRDDVQFGSIHFGISYISSVLKAHGHSTRLFVIESNNWQDSAQLLRSTVEEFHPGLFCCCAVYSQYSVIESISRLIKTQWPDKFIMIGGIHASLNPHEVIQGPFDAVCIGEGEYPTLELCAQIEGKQPPRGIPNLWIKSSDGNIDKNAPRKFLKNLDLIPPMDREMWKPWVREESHPMSILIGRGCPYDCTYCCNHALRKIASGKYVRTRSPENIIKEIASFHAAYGRQTLGLEVESIALDKNWVFELCKQLEAFNATIGNAISYGTNFRISPQTIDEKLFIAFKKANFSRIHIGLESGSERIRKEVLNRHYSNDDFLKVVSMARAHGLQVYIYNMIGIPGETVRDHLETVSLNRQCQPDGLTTSLFFPYPGTRLYDTCIKQGLISGHITTTRERREASLNLPNFSKAQIQSAYTWFNYRVYHGHRPLWIILVRVLLTKITSNPKAHDLYRKIAQWRILYFVRGYVRTKLAAWK